MDPLYYEVHVAYERTDLLDARLIIAFLRKIKALGFWTSKVKQDDDKSEVGMFLTTRAVSLAEARSKLEQAEELVRASRIYNVRRTKIEACLHDSKD